MTALHEIDIDTGKFNAAGRPGDESPGRLPDRRSAPPASPMQRAAGVTRDQEYARSMEERYGIREEGMF